MIIELFHKLVLFLGVASLFPLALYIDYCRDYPHYHKCKTFREYLIKEYLEKTLNLNRRVEK